MKIYELGRAEPGGISLHVASTTITFSSSKTTALEKNIFQQLTSSSLMFLVGLSKQSHTKFKRSAQVPSLALLTSLEGLRHRTADDSSTWMR